MEKLVTKRNLSVIGIISILIVVSSYFIIQNNNKEDEKLFDIFLADLYNEDCLLYTSPSPRDKRQSRMPSSA